MIKIEQVPPNSEKRIGRVELRHKLGKGQGARGVDKNYRLSMCYDGTRHFLVFNSKPTSRFLKEAYRTSESIKDKCEMTEEQYRDDDCRLSMESEVDARLLLSLLDDEYEGIQTPNPAYVRILTNHGFTKINTSPRFRQIPFSEEYKQAKSKGLIDKENSCRVNLHVTSSDADTPKITQRAYAVVTTDGRVWIDYDEHVLHNDMEIRRYMITKDHTWIYDNIVLSGVNYAQTIILLQRSGFTVTSPANRRERLNVTVSATVLEKIRHFMEETKETNMSRTVEQLLQYAMEHEKDLFSRQANQEKSYTCERVRVRADRVDRRGRPHRMDEYQIGNMIADYNNGMTQAELAAKYNLSPSTVHRYIYQRK